MKARKAEPDAPGPAAAIRGRGRAGKGWEGLQGGEEGGEGLQGGRRAEVCACLRVHLWPAGESGRGGEPQVAAPPHARELRTRPQPAAQRASPLRTATQPSVPHAHMPSPALNCHLPHRSLGRLGLMQHMRGLARLEAELRAALVAVGGPAAAPQVKVRREGGAHGGVFGGEEEMGGLCCTSRRVRCLHVCRLHVTLLHVLPRSPPQYVYQCVCICVCMCVVCMCISMCSLARPLSATWKKCWWRRTSATRRSCCSGASCS